MLLKIGNAAGSHSAETISKAWTEHYDDLRGARGIFVVDDPKHELRTPGDVNFGSTGFLRSLLGSRNLLNIQNIEGAREFRYSAPIFCDTNFVSFCGAFFAGRDLKANKESFREAVEYLLPIKDSISAMAYVLENADKADTEKMKSSLIGFIALTRAKSSNFVRSSFNREEQAQMEKTATAALQTVNQTDFRTIHAWVKERYTWSRLDCEVCGLIIDFLMVNFAD